MTERLIPHAAELSGWRKSSYSNSEGGSCVEVLDDHPRGVPVRDSKDPNGPALIFPLDAWTTFIAAIKTEEFSA